MRFKSLCLACRGAKQIQDRDTKAMIPCTTCNGNGWVMVSSPKSTEIKVNYIPKPRENSVAKILDVIKNYQVEFFENGPEFLKPMTLATIANLAGVSTALVCRSIRDKYINGKSVKSLFNRKVAGYSIPVVKQMIENLIKTENPSSPLSDGDILIRLKAKKIKINRRTIAKYRLMLGFRSSEERKT